MQTDVARNAIMGDVDEIMGHDDANIANGLSCEWTCDRILAAAYSGVEEVWIGNTTELGLLYLSQFWPSQGKATIRSTAKAMMASATSKL